MKPSSIFKPLFISLFLILILEAFQILSDINYYPHTNSTSQTLASVAFIFIMFSISFFIFSLIASFVVKRLSSAGDRLVAVVEVVSTIAMAIIYIPAAVLVVKKNSVSTINYFWFHYHSVFPILIILITLLFSIFFRKIFRRIFYNLADILYKPGLVVIAFSFIWAVIFLATFDSAKPGLIKSEGRSAGSTAKGEKPKPDVIVITFDALSAKNMSLYGYKRPTTPYFKELASQNYLFDNMHSNYHLTVPSISSLFTSKYPWTHGAHAWLDHIRSERKENLAATLSGDYFTAAIVPSMYHVPEFIGLKDQFDHVDWVGFDLPRIPIIFDLFTKFELSNYAVPILRHLVFFKNDHLITATSEPFTRALELLDEKREKPVFLWVHLWPAHVPHNPPKPYKGVFLSEDVNMVKYKGRYGEGRIEQIARMKARYDESILFLDDSLKKFIGELKRKGLYDDNIVIVSSDHGQIFDYGYSLVPSPLMYEELFNVPLVVHLPGHNTGVKVSTLAEQIDLAPTILELTGNPIPKWMEGESLVPYMKEPTLKSMRTKYSMVFFYDDYTEVRWFAAYKGEFKLVYQMDTEAAALFKFTEPHTKENNLVRSKGALFRELRGELKRKIDENFADINRGNWREAN